MKVSKQDIINHFESSGALQELEEHKRRLHAGKPKSDVPAGQPQSYLEALHWKGPCVIALWNEKRKMWRYHPMYDGLSMGGPEALVMLDSYAEALEGITAWAKNHERAE